MNLTQALGEAMVKSNETFRRNVPGDTLRFHLRLEDRLLDGRYPSGDPVAVRPDPVWEGHSFQGWLVTADDPAVEAPPVSQGTEQFTMPAANVHLVAQWRTPDPKPEPKPEPEPNTPQVPKTGDPTALWAALSGLSSAGLGLLAWWRRK